jgi:hypothetical protein
VLIVATGRVAFPSPLLSCERWSAACECAVGGVRDSSERNVHWPYLEVPHDHDLLQCEQRTTLARNAYLARLAADWPCKACMEPASVSIATQLSANCTHATKRSDAGQNGSAVALWRSTHMHTSRSTHMHARPLHTHELAGTTNGTWDCCDHVRAQRCCTSN